MYTEARGWEGSDSSNSTVAMLSSSGCSSEMEICCHERALTSNINTVSSSTTANIKIVFQLRNKSNSEFNYTTLTDPAVADLSPGLFPVGRFFKIFQLARTILK